MTRKIRLWGQSVPKDSTIRVLDRVLVDDFASMMYKTGSLSQGRTRNSALRYHFLILERTQVSQSVFNALEIFWFEFSQLSKGLIAVLFWHLCIFHRFSIQNNPKIVWEKLFNLVNSHIKIYACSKTAYSSVSICSKLPSTIFSEKHRFLLVDFSIFVIIFFRISLSIGVSFLKFFELNERSIFLFCEFFLSRWFFTMRWKN